MYLGNNNNSNNREFSEGIFQKNLFFPCFLHPWWLGFSWFSGAKPGWFVGLYKGWNTIQLYRDCHKAVIRIPIKLTSFFSEVGVLFLSRLDFETGEQWTKPLLVGLYEDPYKPSSTSWNVTGHGFWITTRMDGDDFWTSLRSQKKYMLCFFGYIERYLKPPKPPKEKYEAIYDWLVDW